MNLKTFNILSAVLPIEESIGATLAPLTLTPTLTRHSTGGQVRTSNKGNMYVGKKPMTTKERREKSNLKGGTISGKSDAGTEEKEKAILDGQSSKKKVSMLCCEHEGN